VQQWHIGFDMGVGSCATLTTICCYSAVADDGGALAWGRSTVVNSCHESFLVHLCGVNERSDASRISSRRPQIHWIHRTPVASVAERTHLADFAAAFFSLASGKCDIADSFPYVATDSLRLVPVWGGSARPDALSSMPLALPSCGVTWRPRQVVAFVLELGRALLSGRYPHYRSRLGSVGGSEVLPPDPSV
jgi:hypothetical protein